jgi:hypothetical protein
VLTPREIMKGNSSGMLMASWNALLLIDSCGKVVDQA